MIETEDFNAIKFLRTQNGLTMLEMSKKTGVCTSDIVRLERGGKNCALRTYVKIANYFAVPLWALLANDVPTFAFYVIDKKVCLSPSQKRQMKRYVSRMKSGNAGQNAAFLYEVARHLNAGGKYVQDINPNIAEMTKNSFDMPSRTLEGKPLIIEVKSTKGGSEEPIYISARELAKARELEESGVAYLIYRVIYSETPGQQKVTPMTLQEFLEKYTLEPENYMATLKGD